MRLLLLAAIICVTLSCGCLGRQAIQSTDILAAGPALSAPADENWLSRLPPLPLTPPRSASVPVTTTVNGVEATAHSSGATAEDIRLKLTAESGALEWAYYELPTGGFPVISVGAFINNIDGAFYIGISNYVRGCWEFGAATSSGTFSQAISATNVSSAGSVYLVVAAYDAVNATVVSASIVLDQPGWAVHEVAGFIPTDAHLCYFDDGPGGLPHLIFQLDDTHLQLARATVPAPATESDWELVSVRQFSSPYSLADLFDAEFVNSKPAVLYSQTDGDLDRLVYAYALNGTPTDGQFQDVKVYESHASISEQASLCEVARHPRIAYNLVNLNELHLASADTAIPAETDWQFSTISDNAIRPSLNLHNGRLALSFIENSGGGSMQLHYGRALVDAPASPADWDCSEVTWMHAGSFGVMSQLCFITSGGLTLPWIVVVHASWDHPMVCCATAEQPAAIADWNLSELDHGTEAQAYVVSAALVGGRPAVAYALSDAQKVQFAWSNIAAPASGGDWTVQTLAEGFACYAIALGDIGGQPAIAYRDGTSGALKFAVLD